MYKELYNIFKSKDLPEQERFNAKSFFSILGVGFFLATIAGVISSIILIGINYDLNDHLGVRETLTDGVFISFFFSVVFAPIVEEITFRGIFTKSKYIWVASLLLQLHVILLMFDGFYKENLILYAVLSVLTLVVYIKYSEAIMNFFFRKFNVVFAVYILLFGGLHIYNFTNLHVNIFLLIFLVLPQIFIGIMLAYTRVKFGLRYSILMHALYNLLVTLPSTLLSLDNNVLNILTPYFTVSIYLFALFAFVRSFKSNATLSASPS